MGSIKVTPVVSPGRYLMSGNEACALGAVTAGCRFFAGYPITPASDIMTSVIKYFAEVDGKFIQMEDEIGSMAALIGGSWGGVKSMTATSGPGLSLMLENIGLAIMTETPCVVVDVQRSGPSTGQATKVSQGDVLQARWGTHGIHNNIVLAAHSVQSAFEQTIKAFNISEQYRVPVILLLDETVSHARETLDIAQEYEAFNRENKGETPPFGGRLVPDMPKFGDGKKLMITGSTHDENGIRKTADNDAHEKLVNRLNDKIEKNSSKIEDWDGYMMDDAEYLFISFGISARSTLSSVKALREEGIKAGLMTLNTIWPFPYKTIKALSLKVKDVFVPELNMGQIAGEVKKISKCPVYGINKINSEPLYPSEIIREFRSVI
ncbi:2-oxoacid:acceptor oxidoreductase subunit alpha [Candidatus Calescamantes bacterium]|nr:2-oxoacid:acceptor oxidoreductase subunit alpha [Candidatus Calescamantes bacterium]